MIRTTTLLAAGLIFTGLAACNKPAETAPAADAAPAAQGAQGGAGANRMPEKQTLDDMLTRTRERFAKVDTNGDKKITPEEMDAASAAREAAGGGGGGGGGGRGGFGMLARADADKDGVVTLDEAEAQTKARFATMDTNHDGTVTRDEMQAAAEARRAAGGGGGGDGGGPPPSN
ncbi:MAG: hypothetical protein JWP35_4219 [Caulobacter sp.]|nr:hypothetical protein [Caulobacter sp.]